VHDVTATLAGNHGEAVIKPVKAAANETITVTVWPDAGYAVDTFTVNSGSVTYTNDGNVYCEEAQAEISELSKGMEKEQEEYDRLISWAEIYGVCPFETKKMFISQFVKSVRVYRDYELEIEFNVSFEEFRDLRARE
jgi:hypothetical protein